MDNRTRPSALLAQLVEPFTAEILFDQIPDTVFFIKDADGRYVCVNDTLVSRSRKKDKSELLGRTPSAVFGDALGKGYETQDRQVIRSGRQLLDRLELHVYRRRELGWCVTTKLPLLGRQGDVVGLVGISRDLAIPDAESIDLDKIAAAVSYGERHLSRPPTVAELSKVASMSVYQLDRRMKRLFGLSTGQWLIKTRIDHASRRLIETDLPVTDIALGCGYGDHSAFTRQFRRTTGRTPSEFRDLNR